MTVSGTNPVSERYITNAIAVVFPSTVTRPYSRTALLSTTSTALSDLESSLSAPVFSLPLSDVSAESDVS